MPSASSDDGIECPYCGHLHEAESDDAGQDQPADFTCESCERTFEFWAVIYVTYVSRGP